MKRLILVTILICVVGLCCLIGYWTNRQLEVTHEKIMIDDLSEGLNQAKILHVSDIHYGHLRVPHSKLLSVAKNESPDIILITGDTIDRTEDIALSGIQGLINQLADIAPTFVIEGNHEQTSGQYEQWRQLMLNSKATLLENQVTTITLNGASLSLIGLMNNVTDLPYEKKLALSQDRPAIILAHHPEKFNEYLDNFASYPIKAILSGHAHGGQIRVPFIDGLLAPNQGWLPHYTNGAYPTDKKPETTLFVSRGLGNSSFPFRINNKPHLISLTLTRK